MKIFGITVFFRSILGKGLGWPSYAATEKTTLKGRFIS
ncbi:hypothetical protein BDIM_20700 [Brevundimonas diminuta ATCC 11568]|nr:hypothetical protein BDIM_20700 [Brevundimonas diminuta ATCC 11568]